MAASKRKVAARKARVTERTAANQARADAFAVLAGDSKRARRMSEVEAFASVPTIFTGLNRATTVGGAPLSCVWLLHGPSGGGKTAFAIGLIVSFQAQGALAAFVDAEMAADTKRWIKHLGVDTKRCIYIGRTKAEKKKKPTPLTYEEVVEEVDGLIDRYSDAVAAGRIAPGTPLVIVVDSISRMVPEGLFKRLKKKGAEALRSGYGREQAQMNKAWLAELGAKVGNADILFAVIAHENEADGGWGSQDYKVRGGNALILDAMMQARVQFAGLVGDLASRDGERVPQVGKRHQVTLLKNKHGPPYESFYFYTSNGKGVAPIGFDRVREVVHEGLERGIIAGPKDRKKLTLGSKLTWKKREVTLKQLLTKPEYSELVDAIARELDAGLVEGEVP